MNLGLSYRGMSALNQIGMTEEILQNSIQVDGRMIILKDGTKRFHYYAKRDNIINMINREHLANLLINRVKSFTE